MLNSTKQRVRALLTEHYSAISQLCQSYYNESDGLRRSDSIVSAMESMMSDFSSPERAVAKLGGLLNEHFDNAFANLMHDLPKLKIEDQLVFLFAAVGFSPIPIASFLKKKPEFVYNHRRYLRSKIERLDSPRKAFYLALL